MSEWIRCEKELPPMGVPVLAICDDGSSEIIPHVVYRTNGINCWQWHEFHFEKSYAEGEAVFSDWVPVSLVVKT